MKHTWAFGIVFLLVFNASLALADDIPDPRIVIGADTDDSALPHDIYPITGTSFNFGSNESGGGYYSWGNHYTGFYNASGVDWTSLLITLPTPYDAIGHPILDPTKYEVDIDKTYGYLFYAGSIVSITPEQLSILFYGVGWHEDPVFFTGIPNCPGCIFQFFIGLNTNPSDKTSYGAGGWLGPPDPNNNNKQYPLEFTATANGVANIPEPPTFTLLLGGLTVLGLCSCRRKRPSVH